MASVAHPVEPSALPGRGRAVLVLAYRWPPQGGGGVQRTLKLVKYLTHLGWRPVVHTVLNPYMRLSDPSLLQEIPPTVPVYRTPTIEVETIEISLRSVARRAAGLLRGAASVAGGGAGTGDPPTPSPSSAGSEDGDGAGPGIRRKRSDPLGRLDEWLWSRVLVPDPQIVWARAAFLRSLSIARRENAVALYSSSPPNSVNVLALALAERLQLPWVADMRDPWTDGLRRRQWYPDNPRRQAREERWERDIFARAAHVLVTTEPARETFLVKYPWCDPAKITVLTNGFDPADFAHVSAEPRFLEPGLLHVTLTGNVETMFDLVPFLDAVHTVVTRDPDARRVLRFNFVGTKRQSRYDRRIAELGLGDVVRFHAYMPHADVVQYMAESDALMLCQIPEMESGGVKIPGKMCEYLFTRKPILALTIPGVTVGILDRAGVGRIVDPNDTAGIERELIELVREFRSGGVRTAPNESFIATFDRTEQARRVSAILDAAIAGAARSSEPV